MQKRSLRSRVVGLIAAGLVELRVIGTESAGFRLAGCLRRPGEADDMVVPFGHTFARQCDVVGYGMGRFGRKAKKLLVPRDRRPKIAA